MDVAAASKGEPGMKHTRVFSCSSDAGRLATLFLVGSLIAIAPASATTITRSLEISLGNVSGDFGSGQTLSGAAKFFGEDPFVFDVGDTLIFDILFDRRFQVFDFGDPTLEAFSFGLDNGFGSPNAFNGTWLSSIEALGSNGNIWLGSLTLAWQGGGGGFGWGGQGVDVTGSQGSFTGIRWTTQLTSANEGAPLMLSAFTGVQMHADGIQTLPLSQCLSQELSALSGSGCWPSLSGDRSLNASESGPRHDGSRALEGDRLRHMFRVRWALMDTPPLQRGHELHCPHCRRWHPLVKKYSEGTEYTQQMLMWECRGGSYYAGQIGGTSRFPTREPLKAA